MLIRGKEINRFKEGRNLRKENVFNNFRNRRGKGDRTVIVGGRFGTFFMNGGNIRT